MTHSTYPIGLAMLLLFVVLGAGVLYTMSWLVTPGKIAYKTFTNGTCIRDQQAERWEATYRVEMVGKRSYLIRVIPANLWRDQRGMTLSFDGAQRMEVVPCPRSTNK